VAIPVTGGIEVEGAGYHVNRWDEVWTAPGGIKVGLFSNYIWIADQQINDCASALHRKDQLSAAVCPRLSPQSTLRIGFWAFHDDRPRAVAH
jgi:hypothetical protein